MKKIINKIAKSNTEGKITLGIFAFLAGFALAMPSGTIAVNILTCSLVTLSAYVYVNEEMKTK